MNRNSLAFGLCLILIALGGCSSPEDLRFTVTFQDARGLETGDDVVYKGVRIGEVTSVSVDDKGLVQVGVRVEKAHKPAVYREAHFEIESTGGTGMLTGSMQLTMKDRPEAGGRTSVASGEVVRGSEGSIDRAVERLKEAWRDAAEAGKELAREVEEAVRGTGESPETREFVESVKQFASQAKDKTREQYEQFKREELPEIEAQARRLKDKLEAEGKLEEARRFWDRFTAWLQGVTGAEPTPSPRPQPTPR